MRTLRAFRDFEPARAGQSPLRHKPIYATVLVCAIAMQCTSSAPTGQQVSAYNGVVLISTPRPDHLGLTRRLVVRVGTDENRTPRGP